MSYDIDRDVDLKDSLSLGTYNNRSIFFDMYSMNYKVVNFDIGEQKKKISPAGKRFAPEQVARVHSITISFVQSCSGCWYYPQRYYIRCQLKNWQDNKTASNYDAEKSMVQSVMRYNQLFGIQINVTIHVT